MMKKINFLLVSLLVVGAGFISSCTKDEGGSSIDFFGGNYIDADATVEAGASLAFKFTATSETDMELLEVEMTGYGVVFDEEIPNASKNSYTKEVTLTAPANPGTYTYEFIIWDNATGDATEVVSKSITITVTAAAGPISTYASINMGGSSSSYGSYLDAELGTAYTLTQINASAATKATVDVIFDAGKVWNSGGVFTSSTGTKFATTTTTSAQFDAMTTDASFSSLTASLNSTTVAAGSVIFFQTTGGKKGLIKIISLTASNGDLNLAVKIQQ